jgi:hypothetical protein
MKIKSLPRSSLRKFEALVATKNWIHAWATLVCILIFAPTVRSQPYESLPSAAQIEQDVAKYGAKVVVWEKIFADPFHPISRKILEKIKTGNTDYIKVAGLLLPQTDGAASSVLQGALIDALAVDPASVLRVTAVASADGEFSTSDACYRPSVGMDSTDGVERVRSWYRIVRSKLLAIKDKAIIRKQKACMARLSEGNREFEKQMRLPKDQRSFDLWYADGYRPETATNETQHK